MGTSSASPSGPVPRPCTTVDRPCTQAPGGLWDTPRLRRLGRLAALRTGSPSPMSLGRSGLLDGPDDRSPSLRRHTRMHNLVRPIADITQGKGTESMTTFVLIHGSYQGGWIWQRVATRLRAVGHTVS